jgi:hypothetical protein
MGLIRKTASVSTLGLVKFRSKKERLKRAETAFRKANLELEGEQVARAEADRRVSAAERRARAAELTALHEAKAAAKAKRRAKGRRAKRAAVLEERLASFVESAQPAISAKAEDMGKRGRAAAKQAGKVSRRAAARARHEAEPRVRAAAAAASDLADKAKEKLPS